MKNILLLLGILCLLSCSKSLKPDPIIRSTGLIPSDNTPVPVIYSLEYFRGKVKGHRDTVQMLGKADRTVPTVNITAPTSGATVSGGITITATASDNVAVTSTSSYIDDVLVSDDNVSPYSYNWNTSLNANGNHVVKVTARDAAGNVTSVTKTVTVNNTSVYQLAMPPVMSQGSEGSCVAFAVGYYSRSALQYYSTGASSYSNSTNVFSPEYIFNRIKSFPDDCTGSPLIRGLNFAKDTGICLLSTMPNIDGNCYDMGNSAQNAEAATYKVSSFNAIYATDVTAIKSMIQANKPVIIPVNIDDNFFNAGPGYIWDTYNGFWNSHVITICGFDDSIGAYKAINSWGTSWGSAGYIWIDYDLLPVVTYQAFVMSL